VLLAFASTIDLSNADRCGFKGDEATYYSLTYSLVRDRDFRYERQDLVRVWDEYCAGPQGVFLKKGKRIVGLTRTDRFPYVGLAKRDDPVPTRLYYSKSFIYPLVAAPFVWLFATHGFLILNALLLSLDLFVAYSFLTARGSARGAALAYAAVFFGASIVPLYFVWMTPEVFNISLALYALVLWAYKEARPAEDGGRGFLMDARSDYLAAALLGILIFSKPTHGLMLLPVAGLSAWRGHWRRVAGVTALCAAVAVALFAWNAAITGEFNYQGGYRKTFVSQIGYPFANDRETFDNIGGVHGRQDLLVGDVLANRHTLTVLRHNAWYFLVGRSAGLLPYFFPGLLSAALFFLRGGKRVWQWLVLATVVVSSVAMLLLWPFTFSGGGGPIGNRYFLPFYPMLLLLTPPLTGFGAPLAALAMGTLFTAKVLFNPFFSSIYPGEHMKSGPLRWLPLELTLINDLPVAQYPERMKRPLGGSPPVLAYLPDDNAYNPEGEWLWVKGKSSAEIVLRAPVQDIGGGRFVTKAIVRLDVEIKNGGRPGRVVVSTGAERRALDLKASEVARFTLAVPDGIPYRRDEQPTSYLYDICVSASSGFVPFLEGAPGETDSRFLGAYVHLVPEYIDAETSTWSIVPQKN
jgi:hypothetical protein